MFRGKSGKNLTTSYMLLTKRLFDRIRRVNWNIILLELFIVFVGVYLAFLLSNYQEEKRINSEVNKIYTSLKLELEEIRFNFPQRAAYQRSLNEEWDSLYNSGNYPPLYTWRFIQPQYDFTTMEYALQAQGSAVINFELYESLTSLYQGIKRLEHLELLITEIGMAYRNVPAELGMNQEELTARHADNRLLFFRFKDLSGLRANELERMVDHTQTSLDIINARLGSEKRKKIELQLLRDKLPLLLENSNLSVEMVKGLIHQQFPDLKDRDVERVLSELNRE